MPRERKNCHKCGGADHFGSQCKTKTAKPPKPRREEKTKGRKTKKSVMYVRSERDEDEYAFTVNSATPPEKIDVTVGGVVVVMLIDSGASTYVIDKNLWLKLKQDKIDRQICIVTSNETIMSDYKEIFEGVGKLKVLWKGIIRKQKKKP